eukprot:13531-Eustigmatos_ZCMA.PRE.1
MELELELDWLMEVRQAISEIEALNGKKLRLNDALHVLKGKRVRGMMQVYRSLPRSCRIHPYAEDVASPSQTSWIE